MGWVRVSGYSQSDMSKGYQDGYQDGIVFADGRANPESANYQAGVTYADGRSNPSSINYQAGVTYADGRVNTNSASYQNGYQTRTQEYKNAKGTATITWAPPQLGQTQTFFLGMCFSKIQSVYIHWRWMTTAASGMESARYDYCNVNNSIANAISTGVLTLSGKNASGQTVSVNYNNLSSLAYLTLSARNGSYGTWNMSDYSYSVVLV